MSLSALVFAAAAAAAQQVVLEEHPTIRFSDDTFVLGRMRWSYEHRGPDESLPPGKDDWAFIRRRFSVEGGVGGVFEFEIEADLEGDERWKDVYGEYTPSDAVHVRAGKFVIPFGYERTTTMDILDFPYRAMASTHLVPPRDQGIVVLGTVFEKKLSYDVGWFEDGDTLVARLVGRSFSSGPWSGVEIGGSVMRGGLGGGEVEPLRGQTALGDTLFRGGPAESGRRTRVSVHAVYRRGPAAIKSELLTVDDGADGGDEVEARGWYLAGTYVLTGEDEADAHHPQRPLFRGGIGSVEVATRTEALQFSHDGLVASRARAHTLGITWQPIRFFRVQWNAIRDVLPGRRTWTRVLRFHLTI